ncbi:MAG: leucine--tRNA ligase, partial [Waddliaceae bacterium]|nr:leucine--tRNA ligase [Waddliaceae bacterium]
PAVTTTKNIDTFRRQLQALGFSYDWDREVATSDPKYYKWTQWIFTKLFERGLAYEAEMMVNYCPALGTVLANEEVEDGKAKEGGHSIERRPLKQWVLKITAYAERLLDDLDLLDWSEGLKRSQVNWIGKSEGAHVDFIVDGSEETISVFTTRPDTLFGATYMVLSPEHPLVDKVTTEEYCQDVETYRQVTASKSDLERTELSKHKTGVFTGAYAINPVNGEKIPIWIADYVLISYGTGAIMAVPSHDERDFEFATKFKIPIIAVYDPGTEKCEGIEDIDAEQAREEILTGKRCWTGDGICINSVNDDISINDLPVKDAKKTITAWLEEKGTGKAAINYKLRDWLFSRQRYWGEPFPILHLEDGTQRALDVDELPLTPPELDDFTPCNDGSSPLAKATEWVEITDPKTGKKALRETNTMPQWAGSCWYYLRFMDPHNDDAAWSPEAEKYWGPVDMYLGGVEHAVLHLLYARFWHKVLFDCGHVSTPEPFMKLRNQGLITSRSYQLPSGAYVAPEDTIEKEGSYYHKDTNEKLRSQIEKMSKSKLNGVTPDDIVEDLGADALRLYEMFMGPLDKEKVWDTNAIHGCRRFLARFYDIITSEKVSDEPPSQEALKLGNRLVHGVCNDIEAMLFNTAIAKFMEFLNDFSKLEIYPKEILTMATHCLSPLAPHLAEEAWETLGNSESLSYTAFPTVDKTLLEDDTMTYVIQINGKVRAKLDLPKDQDKDTILNLAKQQDKIAKHLEGKEIRKVIFVPNKLLSIVIVG